MTLHIECKACGHQVDVAPAETYVCPACDASEGLHIDVTLVDAVEAHEALRTKGYDEQGKEFLDAKDGNSYFHRTRNGMKSPKSSIAARDATGRRLCANQPAKSSEMRTYR